VSLPVEPEMTVVVAHRKATSYCCTAPLGLGIDGYVCSQCGMPTLRHLGDPEYIETVTTTGTVL
jgi:hypothetical protein